MPEVEIKIRFIGSNNKFPSPKLRWLVDIFNLARLRGTKIPAMEIITTDFYGISFKTTLNGDLGAIKKEG